MPKVLPPLLKLCAKAAGISEQQVASTAQLLSEDNAVPFIVRYRANATGGLGEPQVLAVLRAVESVRALDDRRKTVLKQVEKYEPPVSSSVVAAIKDAGDMETLEDLYLPYKPAAPKGHAAKAREAGFGPLADDVWLRPMSDPELQAQLSAAARKGSGGDATVAQTHVVHLLAERVSSAAAARAALRVAFWERALVCIAAVKPQVSGGRGKAAADGRGGARGEGRGGKAGRANGESRPGDASGAAASGAESLNGLQRRAPDLSSHRVLAINRAEAEGAIRVSVKFPAEQGKRLTRDLALPSPRGGGARAALLEAAADDAYDRLLAPALGRELRRRLSQEAETAAVDVFAQNLRRLLLQRPLRGCVVLGVDPGFKSGCKLAAVDASGRLLSGGLIHPHPPQSRREEAMGTLREWIARHGVSVVAIGNGTASRETQEVVAEALAGGGPAVAHVRISVVNEAGASVLSVTEPAAAADPGTDAGTRGAASLARRLQDPLAELVKVDPASLGVGMYQHDVPRPRLVAELSRVVQACVCHVGVDLNSASAELLRHVAGLTASRAAAVLDARPAAGFGCRNDLLRVKGIGPKSFEQAAGFLRIVGGNEPLDNTAVHPESYQPARAILKEIGVNPTLLGSIRPVLTSPTERAGAAAEDSTAGTAAQPLGATGDSCASARVALSLELDSLRRGGRRLAQLAERAGVGVLAAEQLVQALGAAWLDARQDLDGPLLLASKLRCLDDVRPGELLRGIVRNVTPFGAFVDVGLKDDGLVHSSELSDTDRNPDVFSIVSVGQAVTVRVLAVDLARCRLKLSARELDVRIGCAAGAPGGGVKRSVGHGAGGGQAEAAHKRSKT